MGWGDELERHAVRTIAILVLVFAIPVVIALLARVIAWSARQVARCLDEFSGQRRQWLQAALKDEWNDDLRPPLKGEYRGEANSPNDFVTVLKREKGFADDEGASSRMVQPT
jgi:hypothetical protein